MKSFIVSVPVRAPVWVGWNVMPIWQFPPAARLAPHVFVLILKSPLIPVLAMVSAAVPVLENVTV